MTEFKATTAAVQSIQFVLDHLAVLLKPVLTWTTVTVSAMLLIALAHHPAGADAPLSANLTLTRADHSADALRSFINLFGGLIVGVGWIQYCLLEREPRNPFKFPPHTGAYFVKSIQIGLLALGAALPGIVAAVAIGKVFQGTGGSVAATIVGALSVIAALVVYGRLCILLPSAAIGETLTIREAFEVTKGRSAKLIGGLILCYIFPSVVGALMLALVMILRGILPPVSVQLLQEALLGSWTLLVTALISGYLSVAYSTIIPSDMSDKIAKTFA